MAGRKGKTRKCRAPNECACKRCRKRSMAAHDGLGQSRYAQKKRGAPRKPQTRKVWCPSCYCRECQCRAIYGVAPPVEY